ncbi:MAG: DUF308 domain-containing protein [Odoribacteraceae bacterium]|nr:DUF308 domain-containing protein [Odoribacteraceae bacterium]
MRIITPSSFKRSRAGAIMAILLGLALVTWPSRALDYLVQVIGAAFCLAGIVTLVLSSREARRANTLFLASVAGSVLLGALLCIFPWLFTGVLIYLLGFMLVAAGGWQLSFLVASLKVTRVPVIFYFLPVVTLVAGILVIADPFRTREALVIVFGAASIIAGTSVLANNLLHEKGKGHADERVEDVEHEEV